MDGDLPSGVGGVNVVGFFHAEFGQGEVARRIVSGLDEAGVPVATITLREIPHRYIPHRQEHPFTEREGKPVYDVNILCINAEHLPPWAEADGLEVLRGRYSIGVWFWETSRFPADLHPAFDAVDEVWAASEYVAAAIAAETWKPVHRFPLPVELPRTVTRSRADVGLPEDAFVFLFVFDFFSTVERKNPLGLIEAYRRAFPEPDGETFLLIKTINGDKRLEDLTSVLAAARGRDDIRISDGFAEPAVLDALVAHADCFASLHRSEGFGLTIAEAMARAKPVVATGYSGNLTFMNDANGFLVPYELARLAEPCGPYPAGSVWAEPDLDAAAAALRGVVDRPGEAQLRGERARESIAQTHSAQRLGAFVAGRLERIERISKQRAEGNLPAQRARAYVESGPRAGWGLPSRFRWLGQLYRRFLLRALKPYTVRQREFEQVVAEGLYRAEELDRQHSERINELEATVRDLTQTAERLDAELKDARARVQQLGTEAQYVETD